MSPSWSYTIGQPVASLQNRPTIGSAGSNTMAPIRSVVAKKSPRRTTQSSLPSGSARTTWSASRGCPMSTRRAPNAMSRSTISDWCSGDSLTRSRWIRFFPVFGSGTGKNENTKRVPSVGTRTISSSVSSWTSQCKTAAQKRARRIGSLASKHSVTSRVLNCASVARRSAGPGSNQPGEIISDQIGAVVTLAITESSA